MAERLGNLTDKQRECLRLVWLQYDSKRIARELGLKPDAVDGRLKTAARVLGAENRYEAARILAKAETGTDDRRAIYASPDIATEAAPAPTTISFMPGELLAEPLVVEEGQAPYSLASTQGEARFPPLLPTNGRRSNDVGPRRKLLQISVIAIGTAIAFGALADALKGFSTFLR